jgi:hypothetical protein
VSTDDYEVRRMADEAGVPEVTLRAALALSHPDASPTEVMMRAYDALEPHAYRRPLTSRNGPCVECGRYQEDGPHE